MAFRARISQILLLLILLLLLERRSNHTTESTSEGYPFTVFHSIQARLGCRLNLCKLSNRDLTFSANYPDGEFALRTACCLVLYVENDTPWFRMGSEEIPDVDERFRAKASLRRCVVWGVLRNAGRRLAIS
jgi:hypothetical protein